MLTPDIVKFVALGGELVTIHKAAWNKMYFAGIYNPVDQTWRGTANEIALCWSGPTVVLDDGTLYMLDQSLGTKLMMWLNETKEWVMLGRLSDKLTRPPCDLVAIGRKIYVIGRGLSTVTVDVDTAAPASGRELCGELVGVMDEASTSASGGSAGRSFPPARSGVFYRFTQQDLPAWKPAMTPGCVITIFLIIGITFVPIGLVCLQASNSVAEIVHRYDIDCVPNAYKGNKQAYIKDSSISKKCIQKVQVRYRMKAPIYVYYELDNFYQNHRRYVKSRSDKQLRRGLEHTESSCSPIERSNGLPIVPCGLIAWSLFNDTYGFTRGSKDIMVDRKNISWRSDREHKFGKDVYPFNFQNGSLIGGGKLDPNVPLSNQEDLIVWMRTAALPQFRKLYGVIEEDIQADETITMHITNNYNTYTFGGKKSLVLTTSTWLGGKNDFLGYAYMITGSLSIFLSILFALIHVKVPRPHGDAAYVTWSRKNSSS